MPEAFPAVTTPSFLKYGGSLASASTVVSGRMCSSADQGASCFVFRSLSMTGTTSSAKTPASQAALARA